MQKTKGKIGENKREKQKKGKIVYYILYHPSCLISFPIGKYMKSRGKGKDFFGISRQFLRNYTAYSGSCGDWFNNWTLSD